MAKDSQIQAKLAEVDDRIEATCSFEPNGSTKKCIVFVKPGLSEGRKKIQSCDQMHRINE
jgi:hypothetical protein